MRSDYCKMTLPIRKLIDFFERNKIENKKEPGNRFEEEKNEKELSKSLASLDLNEVKPTQIKPEGKPAKKPLDSEQVTVQKEETIFNENHVDDSLNEKINDSEFSQQVVQTNSTENRTEIQTAFESPESGEIKEFELKNQMIEEQQPFTHVGTEFIAKFPTPEEEHVILEDAVPSETEMESENSISHADSVDSNKQAKKNKSQHKTQVKKTKSSPLKYFSVNVFGKKKK